MLNVKHKCKTPKQTTKPTVCSCATARFYDFLFYSFESKIKNVLFHRCKNIQCTVNFFKLKRHLTLFYSHRDWSPPPHACWNWGLLIYICTIFMNLGLYLFARCLLRVLEPKPPQQTFVHQHFAAAAGHRAVGHVSDASGVFPLATGGLETGDPADVWWAEGQREGEKKTLKLFDNQILC